MIFMVAFIVLCVLSVRDARSISKLRQRVRVLELSDKEENRCFICKELPDCSASFSGVAYPCQHFKRKVTQSPAAAPAQLGE